MADNTLVCGAILTAAASNCQTADPTCNKMGNWISRESNQKYTQPVLYIVCLARLAVHVLCVCGLKCLCGELRPYNSSVIKVNRNRCLNSKSEDFDV